jgi:hypothetical protein
MEARYIFPAKLPETMEWIVWDEVILKLKPAKS